MTRLLPIGLLVLVACGPTEYVVVGTPQVPGTDGVVLLREIEGDNHLVEVELSHLPPPGRLGEGLTVYCLWIVPHGQPPVLGAVLEYDEVARTGRATATNPMHDFEVRVTAELHAQVPSPSEHVVIKQAIVH